MSNKLPPEDILSISEMCRNAVIKRVYFGRTGVSVYAHITSIEPKFSRRVKFLNFLDEVGPTNEGIDMILRSIFVEVFEKLHPRVQTRADYNAWYHRQVYAQKQVYKINKNHAENFKKQIISMCIALRLSGEGSKKKCAHAKNSAKARLRTPFIRAEKAGLCLEDIVSMWQETIVKNIISS